MRITGFSLQAAHLLAQTTFLSLPSWSPETIQTPEGLNFPRNTSAHGSKNSGYSLVSNNTTESEKTGEEFGRVPSNSSADQKVVRSFPQVFPQVSAEMSWRTVDLRATGGRQTRQQAVYGSATGKREQMSARTPSCDKENLCCRCFHRDPKSAMILAVIKS